MASSLRGARRVRSSEKNARVSPSWSVHVRSRSVRTSSRSRCATRYDSGNSTLVGDGALAIGAAVAIALKTWAVRAPIVACAHARRKRSSSLEAARSKWDFQSARRETFAINTFAQVSSFARFIRIACSSATLARSSTLRIVRAWTSSGSAVTTIFPFARAGKTGSRRASKRLIERMPEDDRPDVLAIYPSWWGTLPTWFSSDVIARIPAPGNVICGGYEDVIYKADWRVFEHRGPAARFDRRDSRRDRFRRTLVSEREHAYSYSAGSGWTDMKILPDPEDERLDMFDGGRTLYANAHEDFTVSHLNSRARRSRSSHGASWRNALHRAHRRGRHSQRSRSIRATVGTEALDPKFPPNASTLR